MYEAMTVLIPELKNDHYGKWIIDKENDGTAEHPIQMPFVDYGKVIRKLIDAIYQFQKEHPDFGLNRYSEILEQNQIKWGSESMRNADVSHLDGKAVMSLLMGAVRAERFCDGALLSFCRNGSILSWLERLQMIDEAEQS